MKKLNSKGFTLVELLAVIAVLSIIMTIVVYVATDTINNAKKKSYQVTINNIEKETGNYLIENSDRLFFVSNVTGNTEYQCITIQNLIDMDYFKEDITESKVSDEQYVKKSDYIYIERDSNSKTIVQSIYLANPNSIVRNKCDYAVTAEGDVVIFASPSGWAKEKTVKINYSLRNATDITLYKNYYSYLESEVSSGAENLVSGNSTSFTVTKNGTVYGYIKGDNGELVRKSLVISKIDTVGPEIQDNYSGSGYVSGKVTIPLVVSDYGIGVDPDSFTKDDIVVTIGDKTITAITLNKVDDNNYNLVINDTSNNGEVKITIEQDKVLDKLDNGNEATTIDPGIRFDNVPPVVLIKNPTDETVTSDDPIVIELVVIDKISGIDPEEFTEDDIKVLVGGTEVTPLVDVTYNDETDGDYSYTVTITGIPDTINGDVTILVPDDSVRDKADNPNDETELDTGVKIVNVYQISYELFGGTNSSDNPTSYTYGIGVSSFTDPVRVGHKFLGWYGDMDITYQVTSVSSTDVGDKTLYAYWEPETYTITYKDQGGGTFSGTHASGYPTSYRYGAGATLKNPTKTGYTFLGWCTDSSCSGTTVTNISTTQTGNLTLYAKWQANTYTITYQDCGGSTFSGTHASGYPTSYTYGVGVTLKNPTKTGYTFLGWHADSDCGDDVITSISTTQTGNLTLYAKWRINKIYVRYHMNGGTWGGSTNTNLGYSGSFITRANGPVSSDTTIVSAWNYGATTDANGLANYDNTTYINIKRTGYMGEVGAEWMKPNGDTLSDDGAIDTADLCDASSGDCTVTLYVNWVVRTYIVKYNANGGGGAPTAQTKTHNVSLTLSSTKPSMTNATFLNWNTKADGSGTSYSSGASYTGNAALTLYAIYLDKPDFYFNYWVKSGYESAYGASGRNLCEAQYTRAGTMYWVFSSDYTSNISSSVTWQIYSDDCAIVDKDGYYKCLNSQWVNKSATDVYGINVYYFKSSVASEDNKKDCGSTWNSSTCSKTHRARARYCVGSVCSPASDYAKYNLVS